LNSFHPAFVAALGGGWNGARMAARGPLSRP